MADQQTRTTVRSALTTAGIGTAAVLLAGAVALPAFADGHDNSDAAHGNSSQSNNGNHYGQTKQHTNNGKSGGDNSSASSSDDSSSSSDKSSSGHNPPGNNGTVKIHDVANDHSPHNVPHVGCTFYVDFFGFDNGQSVTVSFAGQAPTGKGTPLGGGQTITPVSTTDAGGAGHDWDYEITRTATDLNVSSLGPPAHQAYHVKMTVATNQPDSNPTAGHKYKVFWIPACTQEAPTATQPSTTDTSQTNAPQTQTPQTPATGQNQAPASTEQDTAGQSSGGATVEAATTGKNAVPTQVLGRQITRSAAAGTAPAASSLPFTGAEIRGLAAAAAIALGGGVALTIAGRRRRRSHSIS